ncbi:hypothetical protein D3C80_1293130 [compost metagenome]
MRFVDAQLRERDAFVENRDFARETIKNLLLLGIGRTQIGDLLLLPLFKGEIGRCCLSELFVEGFYLTYDFGTLDIDVNDRPKPLLYRFELGGEALGF